MKYFALISHVLIAKLQNKYPHPLSKVGTMTMSMGGWNSRAKTEKEYKGHLAELPHTRKLLDFQRKGCVYHQVFDIDRGCFLIEANTLGGLYILFNVIKSCLGFIKLNFSDEIELVRIQKRPPINNCSKSILSNLATYSVGTCDRELFEMDLCSGQVITDNLIENLNKPIRKILRNSNFRKTLACYWHSQNIFYTHLVGSYISCHSLPDLKAMPQDEYKEYNFLLKEKMALSFIAAYRGIESIFNRRFSENDFKRDKNHLSQIIDNKIKGLFWNSNYKVVFYNKRAKQHVKESKVSTMIKHFLIVRNRKAGHGLEWSHTIKARVTVDMVHEIHAFLHYLIGVAMFN